MKDKSTISYWLVQPGEDLGEAIDIMSTNTFKVPEKGEVIHINSKSDTTNLQHRFSHLKPDQLRRFIPIEEKLVDGDFVVVDVKRWIKICYYPEKLNNLFPLESSNITSNTSVDVPISYEVENFEVYVQPFRNTELTETPIAKLRNKMSPIYGYLQVVKAMRDKETDSEELGNLFKEMQNQAIDSIEDIVEFMRNDKIWK